VLDPVADKICLGTGALALVWWRGFPLWLLLMQVGRDALILLAGVVLWRARDVVPAANGFGKAATACMAATFLAYLVAVPAPVAAALTWASAALLLLSGLSYLALLRRLW
jgi:phosphatidylglycerophosphate synthase